MPDLDLRSLIERRELFVQVMKQLKKDAGLAGISSFPAYLNKENFMEKLVPWMDDVLRDPNVFSRLVYQVDIPEVKLKQLVSGADAGKTHALVELFLKRVLQKVVIRSQYS